MNDDNLEHNESQPAVSGGGVGGGDQDSVKKEKSIDHKDDTSNDVNNSAADPQFSTEANPAIKPTIEEAAMLNPNHAMIGVFAPWPSEEVMRRGVLARVAYEGESGGTASQSDQQQQPPPPQQHQPIDPQQQQQQQQIRQTGHVVRDPEEASRRESEKKAKEEAVFTGLDLYVSDDE